MGLYQLLHYFLTGLNRVNIIVVNVNININVFIIIVIIIIIIIIITIVITQRKLIRGNSLNKQYSMYRLFCCPVFYFYLIVSLSPWPLFEA